MQHQYIFGGVIMLRGVIFKQNGKDLVSTKMAMTLKHHLLMTIKAMHSTRTFAHYLCIYESVIVALYMKRLVAHFSRPSPTATSLWLSPVHAMSLMVPPKGWNSFFKMCSFWVVSQIRTLPDTSESYTSGICRFA